MPKLVKMGRISWVQRKVQSQLQDLSQNICLSYLTWSSTWEFSLKRNRLDAQPVGKLSMSDLPYRTIPKSIHNINILPTDPLSVLIVPNVSKTWETWDDIKGLLIVWLFQEEILMSRKCITVQIVKKGFLRKLSWNSMKNYTMVLNLRNVVFVVKVLLENIMWNSTWKLMEQFQESFLVWTVRLVLLPRVRKRRITEYRGTRFLRKVCESEEGSDADPNIWLESFKFFK